MGDQECTKRCSRCEVQKPLSDFNKNKTHADGMATYCRPCCVAYRLEYRMTNAAKLKESDAKYYAKNKARIMVTVAEYRSANKQKLKDSVAAYYAENKKKIAKYQALYRVSYKAAYPEKYAGSKAAWVIANPGAMRAKNHTRRARLRAGGTLSNGLVEKLLSRQNGKCPCCGLPLGDDYHLDHKMPLALGGANEDANMQLLRSVCNLQKGAKHPIDFMRSRGFLL